MPANKGWLISIESIRRTTRGVSSPSVLAVAGVVNLWHTRWFEGRNGRLPTIPL